MREDRLGTEADSIAIVGMAGRFPRSADLGAFWRNLWSGVEGISRFSEQELLAAGIEPTRLANPHYVRAYGAIEGADLFDAEFFGFSHREAEITNPQHRLFLECGWEAFEDAGYDPASYPGAVGVFASASSNTYLFDIYANQEVLQQMGTFRVQIANEKEFLPTWVSYKLNLEGPSVNVQTACSSSLVAVHLACQSLLNGDCDLALVGGVSVRGLSPGGYLYQEGGILSPDGHCRAFDTEAAGTVSGDGVGVILLKRLEDALEDGDNIRAIILGSAINNDGAAKVGYTAPSLKGQTRVVAEALSIAGVEPETVTYVEAHGTGTRLGDPIEVAALTEAFRARTKATGFCSLGALKTNIGHLDAAAGIAGLIKTVLSLEHRRLPPTLHFRQPNPEIDFAGSPFYLSSEPAEWPVNGTPRRAGISSFGIGGTNAHVILEEASAGEASPSRPWQLLVWSARTREALDAATDRLATVLQENEADLADIAYTLQHGRRAFSWRRTLVCRDGKAGWETLTGGERQILSTSGEARRGSVVFLFPGQGVQRIETTRDLYREEATFRSEVDLCSDLLRPILGGDLREVLYPPQDRREEAERRLGETAWAQPAIFVVSWSLAKLWMSWGVKPEAMAGHSLGEYVAACLASVFDLEQALALIALRGRLMQRVPAGGMLAIPLGEAEAASWLDGRLALAAVNAPGQSVVSGPFEALDELEARLAESGVKGRRLRTSHAFHSPMMEPVVPLFEERIRQIGLRKPRLPYLSNVTGDWITPEQATDPGYWSRQLRETVRFGPALGRLLEKSDRILLEVGPGRTLLGLANRHPALTKEHALVPSLSDVGHHASERAALLDALGRLWVAGIEVDWEGFWQGERRRRVSLPSYPFERRRYRIHSPSRAHDPVFDSAAPAVTVAAEETVMLETIAASPSDASHQRMLGALLEIVRDLTGAEPDEINPHASFLEVGVDSLLMIQASQKLQDRFGLKLSVVQLLEELTTLDSVASHLAATLPTDAVDDSLSPEPAASSQVPNPPEVAAPRPTPQQQLPTQTVASGTASPSERLSAPALGAPTAPAPALASPAASALEAVLSQQLHLLSQQLPILSQQLQVLQGLQASQAALPEAQLPSSRPAPAPASPNSGHPPSPEVAPVPAAVIPAYTRLGPYHPIEPGARGGLTLQQQSYLDEFIHRYVARTQTSKKLTQAHRPVLADGRASVGFRRLWKELIYPIHGQCSRGSRIWDVDGNEYVDICMGFGLHFFGHSPDFVIEAIERQMREGIELGPQSPLAGRAARLICELTGMDRAIFCNSGTEAVIGALRAARTWTRRTKIALLSGSYHGWSDSTLARSHVIDGCHVTVPGAPGVPPSALEDVLVLDYDSPESLELLAAHGEELAAVLVEPVRSRSPEIQPREYLRQIRELTARSGTLLIFDEMVSGFRVHPGGAQAVFGIEADLATYGKLLAGGLPIGVLAGRSRFMDVLDGGMWSFGDDSYPTSEKTMMAGAFFKHPLTMAVTCAVLERMQQEGTSLHDRLNARTARLVHDLNADFAAVGAPIDMVCFGSLFRFRPARDLQYAELFFYHLLEKGIFYTLESGNCFLTTAHTEEDLEKLRSAVRQSVFELQKGGFLPGSPSGPPPQSRREPFTPATVESPARRDAGPAPETSRDVELSLYYFGNYAAAYDPAKYELLIEGARFADEHGFSGIWLPERHFHPFGGLSPNPAVLAAALARETKHLSLRAGSAVVPLQHPIRLAEDWSLVDNLSGGRAGVSFASGWHSNDFVLAPQAYSRRREIMYEGIEKVRALWRGEPLRVRDGAGAEIDVYLHPQPKQREIPIWLTAASPDTFIRAGEMGCGVLTNLQTQSLEDLGKNLELYREALVQNGHRLASARVTLLLHTYVGSDLEAVREKAARPLRGYLRSSLHLTHRLLASSGRDIDLARLPEADLEYLLGLASQRYMADHALVGTPETCAAVIEKLRRLGVTEIGCLVDFGLDTPSVLEGLSWLVQVQRRPAVQPAPRSAPVPTVVELPLTEPHRALWVASRLEAGSAYNEPLALRLKGPFDLAAMHAALQGVVDRHHALRATFSGDGLRQRIGASMAVDIPLTDLSDLSGLGERERGREAASWLARQAAEPFDLERGPLLRCAVARLGAEDHYFSLTIHHLVIDGHSGGVMLRDLLALYTAARRGEPSPLGEATALEEHVHRVDQELRVPEQAQAEAYWTGIFSDAVPQLELPTDRPRAFGSAGALRACELDPALLDKLRSVGAAHGITFFAVLLSAYGVLLHRLSGEEDFVIGVPSRDPAAGAVVGYFIHLLPLRLRMNTGECFHDFAVRVRRRLLEGQEHRGYPAGRLLERFRRAEAPGRPFITATFNVDTIRNLPPFADLRAEFVRVHQGASRFEIHFNVVAGETPRVECGYRTQLFDATTIDRWLRLFRSLLHAIVREPESQVAELPWFSAAERHQLLQEWNGWSGQVEEPCCLHELFVEWARRSPGATAVMLGSEQWTYGELEERSERLAVRLQSLGVGPEVRVGLCLERSFEMVVGLLAILRAGGVYVPLDPSNPRNRLLFLLKDARVSLLLTQRHLATELEEPLAGLGSRFLCLEEEPAGEIVPVPRKAAGPDHLAYVIYTSGSTGVPNGVMVPHRGAVNLLREAKHLFRVEPGDRVLQMLSLSFDASILEIFLALSSGASLCLATEEERRVPWRLAETISRQRVTTAVLTPSVLSVLPEKLLASVRSMSVGGEACPRELVARWVPGRRLLNCYGPTEATIFATVEVCSGQERSGGGPPIGRAVAHVETYVVDRELRPVPIGVAGELLLGGAGLARGYLERPDKTAQRFIPHPFIASRDAQGARLYRTGDLVRLRPDGRIDFLGRLDNQVKVRGFRVELGEIESVLSGLPGVREAAVAVHGEREGQKLVAYVMPEQDWQGIPALRQGLRERLPDYMVPALWVELSEPLPRTPAGKVDRRSLQAPGEEREAVEQESFPRTPLESFLVDLWREILLVDRVGLHQDFFALGGHSLTGAVLVNRLQEAVGEIVHVVVIFDAPTVSKLARYLGEQYPQTVARIWGEESLPEEARASLRQTARRIDAAQVEELRQVIVPLAPRRRPAAPKNPQALFVLSPPRSGSTLLRVMLGGHPQLFSPPELELLSFDTLAERREAFTGRNSYWLEGATRAVMEILGCDAEAAEEVIATCERETGTTQELYRRMQEWIGDRRLVDKTPSYALDLEVLRRAEEIFDQPLYVHLVRHPCGMIHSFEEARLEQVFFRHPHTFGRRELAELIWVVSQQNILRFLEGIPESRRHRVHFEHLVREPKGSLERICTFAGLDFHPAMLEPYQETRRRMTDGIHSWSRMLGDVKFHQHSGIEVQAAERWRERLSETDLGEITRDLAHALGYETEPDRTSRPWTPITPVPRDGRPLPLSFAQQRLWFLDRLGVGGSTYNISTAVLLRGRLDVAALSAALNEVVRRHEILRTTFDEVEGEPFQVVAPPGPLPLLLVDLASCGEPERSREAGRLAEEMAHHLFDLARGPLLRSILVRLGELEHLALLTMHHIVSDGWSAGILIRELGPLYAAFSEERPSPLLDLQIQYADFASWQGERLAGEEAQASLAYWCEQLGGSQPVLDLPLDRPRPPLPTFHGARRSLALSPALSARLRELSLRHGVSLFMALLASLQALLARYSGQDAVAVGTPVAGRNHRQTEDLIGFFVNTLVLRTDLSGDPGPRDLLERVRRMILDAYAHQDLPFEKLVEKLQPVRSLSHSPLFQVMFVFQNLRQEALHLPGLTLEPVAREARSAKFDLTLIMAESGRLLTGSFEYNTDLFHDSTVQRMARHFVTLLEGLTGDPERRISTLPFLGEAEQAQVVREWNDTAGESAGRGRVHEEIAGWASSRPDAAALFFEGRTMTYRELDLQAGLLAGFLRASGVGLEDRIGICLEPSPEMIVALLGILRAGGAYVPLDPDHPTERQAWMLDDAGVTLVLSQERFREALSVHPVRQIYLDSEKIGSAGSPPATPVSAANAVYVIYTSGSTGMPKGVVATHGGLASFTRSMARALALGPGDRMLQFASLTFDASAVQIFPPLASGATLVLHPNPRRLSSEEILSLCARAGVTVLDLPAALWRQWVADLMASGARVEAPIRMYLTGGEAVPVSVLRDWASRMDPGTGFLSSYGPTEATVTTTAFQTSCWEGGPELDEVPLGRPLENVQVYVLDGRFFPVPAGVAGEVFIGGAGVTRGYLRRPALTAERYLPDPWSNEPGGRLYRTGDLARRLADGTLQFLGRRDDQVKLRGFRVELGEIEAAIRGLPGVLDPAVVLVENGRGERQLVACVAPAAGVELSAPAVLGALQDLLPGHMVPSRVLTLSELPLTRGGKVDRLELARRAGEILRTSMASRELVLPRTRVELELARMFEEFLDVHPISLSDNFFELGGHSLLAVRLIAGIKARLGQDLPLAALFEEPTLGHLARRLEATAGEPAWSPLVPIQPEGSAPPLFCVHPIGGGVLGYRSLAHHLELDQPLYGLQAPGLDAQAGAPHSSVEEMAAFYLSEVCKVQPCGPYRLAGASFGGVVAFEMAQQLRRRGETVEILALFDTPVPLEAASTAESKEMDLGAAAAALAREQARQRGKHLALTAAELQGLPLEGQLERVLEGLREIGVAGSEIDVPWLLRYLHGLQSRMRAVESYKAEPYSGQLLLFRPLETDPEHLRIASPEWQGRFQDPTLGWGHLAETGVEVYRVPGFHETMLSEPHVRDLAALLGRHLSNMLVVEA